MHDWGSFEVGNKIMTMGRTITEGDFTGIVNISWENGPLHTDEEYMKTTPFGRRILGGPCLIALIAGLSTTPLYSMWGNSGLNCVAGLGIDNVRYHTPFHPNDTLTVEIEVISIRETVKIPGRYVGRIKDRALKQNGETVLEMERTYLLEPVKSSS